jgi:hypothetical protein
VGLSASCARFSNQLIEFNGTFVPQLCQFRCSIVVYNYIQSFVTTWRTREMLPREGVGKAIVAAYNQGLQRMCVLLDLIKIYNLNCGTFYTSCGLLVDPCNIRKGITRRSKSFSHAGTLLFAVFQVTCRGDLSMEFSTTPHVLGLMARRPLRASSFTRPQ